MQEISASEIVQRVLAENPWWRDDHKINSFFREMKRRAYFSLLMPLVKDRKTRRAVVLMGPRRVGKTVLIHHAIQALIDDGFPPNAIAYFSVDHPLYNGLSLEKLLEYSSEASGTNYKRDEVFVFFDEIQYLRNWEVHLKSVIDTYPNIRLVASGSAAAASADLLDK